MLEYLASECMNLDIQCDGDLTQQQSGEHSYVKRIERINSGSVSQNVSSPVNPNLNAGSAMNCILPDFVTYLRIV